MLSGIAFLVSVVLFGFLFAQWYLEARSELDFCNTPYAEPLDNAQLSAYPQWVLQGGLIGLEGIPAVEAAQQRVRDVMDRARPSCVPCPNHAKCFPGRLYICDSGFHKRSLEFLPFVEKCIVDYEQHRKLDVVRTRIAEITRQNSADARCSGHEPGVLVDDVYAQLKSVQSDLLADDEFEVLWEEALDSLTTVYTDVEVVTYNDLSEADLDQFMQKLTPPQKYPLPNEHGHGSQFAHFREAEAGKVAENGNGHENENENQFEAEFEAKGEVETEALADANAKLRNRIVVQPFQLLVSHSWLYVPLSCKIRIPATRVFIAHRDFLLLSLISFIFLLSLGSVVSRIRRRRRRVAAAVEKIVAALQQQRASSEKTGGPAYIRTIKLRQAYAKDLWPEVARALASLEGARQNQREVYGEINETWEWTL